MAGCAGRGQLSARKGTEEDGHGLSTWPSGQDREERAHREWGRAVRTGRGCACGCVCTGVCVCVGVALRDGERLRACFWSTGDRARASPLVISLRLCLKCVCGQIITPIFIHEEKEAKKGCTA